MLTFKQAIIPVVTMAVLILLSVYSGNDDRSLDCCWYCTDNDLLRFADHQS